MKPDTRYAYEKRIEDLQRQVDRLRPFETLARHIFRTVADVVSEGKGINCGWLLKQYENVFR